AKSIVGVWKKKVYVRSRGSPPIDFAVASMVTSNFVANGKGDFGSGVKISDVVPYQRKVPLMGGVMWKNGAVTTFGIFPTSTIGLEKTTRISFASAMLAISPTGPALVIVNRSAARTLGTMDITSAAREPRTANRLIMDRFSPHQ